MGHSAQWDAQVAIVTALKNDNGFLTGGYQIYDGAVPETVEPRWPYIVVGESTENGADILTRIGRELTVTLHIFSRYRGAKELKQLAGMILDVLDRKVLHTDDWTFPVVRLENSQSLVEEEDQRHGILTMRLTGQPK